MTQRILIQLGKTGDVINLLPLALIASKSGKRLAIMACKEFAGVLDGCSYVDAIPFDGGLTDIAKAVEEAKKLSSDVVCCQVLGPPEVVNEYALKPSGKAYSDTESFAKEAWRICGQLDQWKHQPPLVFDQRSEVREAALLSKLNAWITGAPGEAAMNRSKKTKRLLLVALDGTSSPFKYKRLVMELCRGKFWRTHNVIDLAEYKSERIYDLLALYEKASVLVASDSAPLHLAWAVRKLPVVALINDQPTLWHGSPWRPTHIRHIRYGDFFDRAVEIIEAIESIGDLGCPFNPRHTYNGCRIVHVWSRYEETEKNAPRRQAAKDSWIRHYANDRWVSCPIEVGSVAKDSANTVKDELRVPLVKDVIRLAMLRADDDDLICLTRADTCFPEDPITKTLVEYAPCYARRMVRDANGRFTYHPAVDLFAFTKKWWRERQRDFPDLLLGKDFYWHRVLMEFIKLNGGKELPFTVYQTV